MVGSRSLGLSIDGRHDEGPKGTGCGDGLGGRIAGGRVAGGHVPGNGAIFGRCAVQKFDQDCCLDQGSAHRC